MGIIIPIDCHILQKGFSSTNQIEIFGFTTGQAGGGREFCWGRWDGLEMGLKKCLVFFMMFMNVYGGL